MMILNIINLVLAVLFMLCYAFQMIYLLIPFIKKLPAHKEPSPHRFAILVCARNEEKVIGDLIASIRAQDYPSELIDIVLVADNCTDGTAERARELGVTVYERFNDAEIGKGYALDFGLKSIDRDFGEDYFDAFIVFDADNILTENFVTEINKTFSDGYEVVTCYRNSKNYGESWLSAGTGLWYIRESKYLNGSRMRIGACPQVAGTGFLFSNKIKKENGGWPFHTLTEDYEFTCYSVVQGKKFGYCESARFYDEHVPGFIQSWKQRLRWCKGGLQSFVLHWRGLTKNLFTSKFIACYDMLMSIAPAYMISIVTCLVNIIGGVILIALGNDVYETALPMLKMLLGAYLIVLLHSTVCTVTEWKHIKAPWYKKILYMFTFPFYLMTFVPICFIALFKKDVTWARIEHNSVSSEEARKMSKKDDE